jgi:tetraacyldisaccharide 4'-kinase
MPLIDYLNPYAYAMLARRRLYELGWFKSYHPGIPVISVGNLTLGGTGKSPLVLLIADYLERKHGRRVAIVSRGYKRHSKGYLLVRNGGPILASVEASGDEAQMFAESAPNAIVIVVEDRSRGANQAKLLGAEVIVLDDGYQHLRLRRDFNILLTDGHSLPPVLPFGRSREPGSAVRAADVIIASDVKDRNDLSYVVVNNALTVLRSVPSALTSLSVVEVPLSELQGKRVLALSSIANPKRFHEMLLSLGAKVVVYDLGDHAEYSAAIAKTILDEAKKNGAEMIVTTAKDAVKSRKYFQDADIPVFVLHHKLEFLSGEKGFYEAIDKIL